MIIHTFVHRALQPPNWRQSWLVGVRVAANKKLVAFISGIPVALRTYEKYVKRRMKTM